jgi:formylglycine-generating enzyme required for sulfatase activity
MPEATHGNFDFYHWDPVDVDATPGGDSAFGISQLIGNGWEWTRTPFGPFQGFQPFPFYPGYSKNFFDEEHYVMKGASPRTAACFLRSSFRNWFRPDYPHVYASFRLTDN